MKNKLIFFVTMLLNGFCIQASYQEVGFIETAHKYIPVYCNPSQINGSQAVQLAENRITMVPVGTNSIYVYLYNGIIFVTPLTQGKARLRD